MQLSEINRESTPMDTNGPGPDLRFSAFCSDCGLCVSRAPLERTRDQESIDFILKSLVCVLLFVVSGHSLFGSGYAGLGKGGCFLGFFFSFRTFYDFINF